MFNATNGDKMIDLNDAIATATDNFLSEAAQYGDSYNPDRVSHEIGNAILDLLDSFSEDGIFANKALQYHLNKRLGKLTPIAEVVELFPVSQAA
jgi:hypothetical protein